MHTQDTSPLYPAPVRKRYRSIAGFTGMIGVVVGLVLLLPLPCLLFYGEETALAWNFALPGIALLVIGALLAYTFLSRDHLDITYREGWIVLALSWMTAVLAGAVPFAFSLDMNFTEAVFESTSGWTTTGLSVVDVNSAPRLVLFYRSALQFFGGAGFAVIMLSALAGPRGTALSATLGKQDQLAPHIKRSARLVGLLYAGYALLGVLLLRGAGMSWFDALNHAFAAVSTGGFSTHPQSIGFWNSPTVEGVTIVLMLLGGTSFVTTYLAMKGRFACLKRNGELHLAGLFLLIFSPFLFFFVTQNLYPGGAEAARIAIFQTISALTTSGFSTVVCADWSDLGWLVLILLMLVGGGTGCTAGGIKQYRIYVLYRGLLWEFRRKVLPRKVITDPDVWHGEDRQFITDEELGHVGLFVFLYVAAFLLGVFVLCAHGYSLRESAFEFASALGTVGLSVGVTKATAPQAVLWTQIFGMLLGRLEFFILVVGFVRIIKDVISRSGSKS